MYRYRCAPAWMILDDCAAARLWWLRRPYNRAGRCPTIRVTITYHHAPRHAYRIWEGSAIAPVGLSVFVAPTSAPARKKTALIPEEGAVALVRAFPTPRQATPRSQGDALSGMGYRCRCPPSTIPQDSFSMRRHFLFILLWLTDDLEVEGWGRAWSLL